MELRVLGPLEASVDRRDVPLAGPKQRQVLAHLVVEANRVVPADRLIDRIWGEEPPEAARAALQAYVSRLRKSLGAATIEARPPGYVLRARPDEIDAVRFESMLSEARRSLASDPAAASALLEDALALWRGPAYADLAGDASLQGEITRLEELRLSAVEDHTEAGLALARHGDLIPRIETVVAEHPLRERSWAHLMLALYRTGRQGDALGAYQRARSILADELGLDPSPDLQRLHERILRQDPTLELTGRPLRGYRLFEEIGAGAFGSVHRALQPEVGREVAVKVIHRWLSDDPDFIRRFEREAQRVARLEHAHIVPVYDYWRDPGGAYLVMRYVRGGNLAELLRTRGPFQPGAAADLLDQLAAALAVAHREGVVHRDIRPTNVLLDEDGNAYLADFSIAKDLAATEATAVSTGLIYSMSPEELRGEPVTPVSDVYCLGLVLYEVLAGRYPFADTPAAEVRERLLSAPIPRIGVARPDLPPGVEYVLERATAKDPAARYPDAPSLASAFRFALEAGAQVAALPAMESRNPYKGLRPFLEADAPDFFGREALIARLAARLGQPEPEARFLAVVGPSGSGKSSLVRAGLIPALRNGALPGSQGWFVVEMHPGADPFAELEAALLGVAVRRPVSLVEELERDRQGLVRAAGWVLPPDDVELLLVIDQFEEVFTLVQDPNRRAAFLDVLHSAVSDPESRVRVVVALRADFYDRPLLHKAFGDLLGARTQAVTGLSAEELERAIAGPAGRVGVTLEPGLLATILAEVGDQPGALPLLQYALTELFEGRGDSALTLGAYEEMGGVLGALGRRAEEIFARLGQPGKDAAHQLFLRLVTVGDEGTAETRRRVLRAELASVEVDRAAMEGVIDAFDSHRLLSFDRDPVTRGPTVEVAHEALLREWGRLRGWIGSAREDVRAHHRLAAAVAEWEGAGRDPSFLLRGERLSRSEAWSSTSGIALTGDEREYIEASVAARESERAAEEVRQAREVALERRSRLRLRALVAVLTVATLIASTLTVVALDQRTRAQNETRRAIVRELGSAALANLDVDPELSILLALEAVETARSADRATLLEAEEVLHRAVVSSRIVATIPLAGTIADWSAGGDLLALAGGEDAGTVQLRVATTGEQVRTIEVGDGSVDDVEFNADGSLLATAGASGVKLWDPSNGVLVRELHFGGASGLSFSADGRFVAAASAASEVLIWGTDTGQKVAGIPVGRLFRMSTALSPDGSQVAVVRGVGADVYDVETGEKLRTLGGHVFNVTDVDWNPTGSLVVTTGLAGDVRLWDPSSGKLLHERVGVGTSSDWSPDGRRLITGVEVWQIGRAGQDRPIITLPRLGVTVSEVAFGPDGTQVLTADERATARIWDLGLSGDAEWLNLPAQLDWDSDVAFSPDGTRILASYPGSAVRMWETTGGEEILTLVVHEHPGLFGGEGVAGIAVSPDGRMIATAGRDAMVRVWDSATGEELFTFNGHGDWVEEVRFSPDGKLLATASLDGTARILDVATWRELYSLEISSSPGVELALASVQFSPDGRSLVTGSWDGTVRVWDVATGRETTRIQIGAKVDNIAIGLVGSWVAVTAGNTFGVAGAAGVWDLRSGEPSSMLEGHSAFAVAVSPDGLVAIGSHQSALVWLWDPEAGTVLTLRGHSGDYVTAVAFSPDGSRLASLGQEGTVRVWAVDLDDLIAVAERELTRTFTDEECRRYLHVDSCPSEG